MKSLLRTGLIKSRFIALLNLGLSAVVVGATPPPVYASVSPAVVALHVFETGEIEIDKSALPTAPPTSIEGKLFAYQRARLALEASVTTQNKAYGDYLWLSGLSRAESNTLYPDGDYRATLAEAVRYYNDQQAQAERDFHTAELALVTLTGGEALTVDEMAELHQILGL